MSANRGELLDKKFTIRGFTLAVIQSSVSVREERVRVCVCVAGVVGYILH